MTDLSHVCNVHHSSQHRQILTHWMRPGIEPETSWFLVRFINHWATTETPFFVFLYGLCFKVSLVWYEYWSPAFLYFPFVWNIFFHPLTFNLYVSSTLRWVSCREESLAVSIQSATLCVLIGAFGPLTLALIIDKYVFIAILNFAFQLTLCFFVPFFFDWMISFCFMLVSSSF